VGWEPDQSGNKTAQWKPGQSGNRPASPPRSKRRGRRSASSWSFIATAQAYREPAGRQVIDEGSPVLIFGIRVRR
jgi:hypothetical protein